MFQVFSIKKVSYYDYPSLLLFIVLNYYFFFQRDPDTGEEPSLIRLWDAVHFNKKMNQWINEKAVETHASFINLKYNIIECNGLYYTC